MKLLVLFPLLLVALIVGADDVDINAFREKVEGMKLLKKDLEDDVQVKKPDTVSVDAVQTEKPYPVAVNDTLTLNLTSTKPDIDAITEDVIVERADVQNVIAVDKSMLPVDIRELLKSQSEKREANAEDRPESDARPLEDDAQKSVRDRLAEGMVTGPEERDIDSLPYGIRELLISQFKKPEANADVKPESDARPLDDDVTVVKPDALIVGGPFPPPPEEDGEIIERGSGATRDEKQALRGNRHGDKISDKTDGGEGKEGPGLDVDGDLLSLKLSRNGDQDAVSEKRTGRGWGKLLGPLVKAFTSKIGKIAANSSANAREESDAVSDEAVDVEGAGKDVNDVSEKTTSRGGAMVKLLGGLAKLITRAAAKKKNEANEDAAFDVDVDAEKEVEDGKTDVSSGWEGVRKAIEKHFQETQDSGNENTEFGSVDGDEFTEDSDVYDNTEGEEEEDIYIVVEGADGRPELIRRPDDGLEDVEEEEEEDVNEEDEDEDEDEDGMEFQSLRGAIKGAIKIGTKLIKGGVKVIKKGARVIKNVGRKTIRAGRKYKSHFKRFGKKFVEGGVERVFNTDGEGGDYERRETEEEEERSGGYEEQDEAGEGDAEAGRGPVRGHRGGTRVRSAPVFVRKSGNGPVAERAARGRPTDGRTDEDEDHE